MCRPRPFNWGFRICLQKLCFSSVHPRSCQLHDIGCTADTHIFWRQIRNPKLKGRDLGMCGVKAIKEALRSELPKVTAHSCCWRFCGRMRDCVLMKFEGRVLLAFSDADHVLRFPNFAWKSCFEWTLSRHFVHRFGWNLVDFWPHLRSKVHQSFSKISPQTAKKRWEGQNMET